MKKTMHFKTICLAMVLVLAFMLTGCAQSTASAPEAAAPAAEAAAPAAEAAAPAAEAATEERVYKIAHIAPGLDESQRELYQCMACVADEINNSDCGYKVQYDHYSGNFDLQTQITQIETVITKGDYDAMIVFATDAEGIIPSVKNAYDAGIGVVDIMDYDNLDITNIRFLASEEIYADMRDEFLLDYAEEHADKQPLKTCILYGVKTQLPQLPRGDRMYDLAEAYPDKFTVLDAQTGDWDATKALNITEDWITRFGADGIDYICSSNDGMATGAIQALAAVGKAGEVLTTGVDLTDEGLAMIQEGKLGCSIGQDWFDYALALTDCCIRIADDPVKYNHVEEAVEGLRCITADNVDEYLAYKAEWKEKTSKFSINE